MYKVMKTFVCRACVYPVIGTVCTSVDIGVNANLELVDTETRIRTGWNKFRQLVPLLTNKDISLIVRGRLYSSCVLSSMLHGSET